MSADIPEPTRAKMPLPPPEADYVPEADYAPRAVNVASAPLPHATTPPDSNGSVASGTLNADPDSLRQVHKEARIGIQVPNPEATGGQDQSNGPGDQRLCRRQLSDDWR